MASPNQRLIRRSSVIGLILALIGLGLSIYLTVEHYTSSATLACPETGIVNCAKVTSSSYSEISGIPLPLLGLGFFAVMIPLQLPRLWHHHAAWLRRGRVLLALGSVPMVLWLVYVELFKLNAICLYCTGVHIVSFLLLAQVLITTALLVEEAAETPVSSN